MQPELIHLHQQQNLKAKIDKVYVDKSTSVSNDLSKLSNIVNNDFVKKLCIGKINNIDTSGFALKTKDAADKSDQKRKLAMQTKDF